MRASPHAFLAFALLCFGIVEPAWSQQVPAAANVVSSCGTPNGTYGPNTNKSVTQTTGGNLCINGTFSQGVTTYTTTDEGGTITTGGTAQTAIASNSSRKIWCIQNDPAATETLFVRVNGTASTTTGIGLNPGIQACSQPLVTDTASVSVYAATTGHRWYGFEGQ